MAERKKKQSKPAGVLQLQGKPSRTEPAVEDTPNTGYATEEIDEVIIDKAVEWYRLGASRGAIEAFQAVLDGTVAVEKDRKGNVRLVAKKKAIEWKQALTVNTVANRIRTESYKHKLTIGSLGFK